MITLPSVRPLTDDERIQLAHSFYGLDDPRRAMADAVIQRDLEHAGQLDTFAALRGEIWSAHPGPEGLHLTWARLVEFGAAWAATEARHDAAIAAALHKLDALEAR